MVMFKLSTLLAGNGAQHKDGGSGREPELDEEIVKVANAIKRIDHDEIERLKSRIVDLRFKTKVVRERRKTE